jgi:hypothetical protein
VPRLSMVTSAPQRPPGGRLQPHRALPGALLAVLLLLLALAAPAGAGEATKILEACGEGRVPKGYSQQAYRQALRQMSPTLSEYTACSDLIHKAQLAAAAGGAGGAGGLGGGGSSGLSAATAPPTPSEQRTLERVKHTGATPVQVGGEVIHPGVVHADIASALSTLPTPLLALIAFLLVCALVVCGAALRNRVRRRSA